MIRTRARYGSLHLRRQTKGMLRVQFREAPTSVSKDLAARRSMRMEEAGRPELVHGLEEPCHQLVAQPRRRLERISSCIYQRPV